MTFFARVLIMSSITNSIIKWYTQNKRDLPWRHTKDPYKIWLSEVMLQQTRVQQGLPYYENFSATFPTITDFANADEQQILTMWQGLGYYSRARNMHTAAKQVVELHNGIFPNNYTDIIALKGVGEYTAAAISSFAFDLSYPVIDGNVYRVITRLFNITDPINKPAGHKAVNEVVKAIFDQDRPALFNQAIMEFGALQCTPKKPKCEECPLQPNCSAYELDKIALLPYKDGKTKVIPITHSYLVIHHLDSTFIQQRTAGIWQNLHQFPLVEEELSPNEVIEACKRLIGNDIALTLGDSYTTTHLLSHRKINAHFHNIYVDKKPHFLKFDIFETLLADIGAKYPISVLIQKYLNQAIANDK
ncbi:MAG: A/G-specific adenine glycosylase [Bacteroidia bacterium]|jgi:A/G-specific adenine glycosylase